MLSLLARDKILLKHVRKIDACGLYGTGPKGMKKKVRQPAHAPHQVFDTLLEMHFITTLSTTVKDGA